jgi:hypothetical protein
MNRPFRTAPFGAVLALGLAACGGAPSALPGPAALQPQHARAQQGLPGCHPDSYGYCYTTLGTTSTRTSCYNASGQLVWIFPQTTTYRVIDPSGDPTDYAKTVTPACGNAQGYTTWNPADPAAVTGDPNLP